MALSSESVFLELPDATEVPGIRDGITQIARWKFDEVTPGWAAIEPNEGAHSVYGYFRALKLCDANTTLTRDTWEPLRRSAKWTTEETQTEGLPIGLDDTPDPQWQKRLIEWGEEVGASGRRGAEFAAISATLIALDPLEVPAFLHRQMPEFFKAFPEGSLWLFEADRLLVHRISLLRVLLSLQTLPDLVAAKASLPQLHTLQEHSLTSGAAFDALVEPLLLAIPPATLGYCWGWMPHGLVFLFGHPTLLIEEHPPTFASLYAPRIQNVGMGFHWRESEFFEGVRPADIESLLQWWASRLNVIYSYATDPTNFGDEQGRFHVTRQTVWFLTFERLMADALAILSSPQASGLSRHEMAFDLLDKAEALLGYGSDRSGKGFQHLLRRRNMVSRLDRIWDERLPVQLRARFKEHTHHLYDRVYEHARAHTYDFRLTTNGVNVWSTKEGRLVPWTWDAFVPRIIRAVRNSAHGLMETFEGRDRELVVAHSGEMAPELPELAAFLALALVADAERLCDKTWLD